MATSSRQSNIFGVNDWKSIYKTYNSADFQSYDYESLRKNFVDYLRAYYPETFNDYVESSEYIALLDVIAFMGQGLAFRDDLNSRENFIDTAERRDSIIKLANLIGYNPKRNIAGQGFLKFVSVQTTEPVSDINGLNLSNINILWNDPANPNWQEQFNTVINAALVDSQRVGRPGNSQVLLDVQTDEYAIKIPTSSIPTSSFGGTVDNVSMAFECISATSVNSNALYEKSPYVGNPFNILYRNDKLGYGSPNTGFFAYFKQGTLQSYYFNITEQTTNQVVDINIEGINNTDTWLFEINPTTGALTEWKQVDNIYSNQNTQIAGNQRKVFSVSSRFNDQVSYHFGDGIFSEIPVGNFVAYVRSGNALTYTINPGEFSGIAININYISKNNRTETLSLTLELTLPVTTAQARETLANIKSRAPQQYYTQNRMVNGEDYNNFPYTLYSSIIKSKAINRSSVGISRNYDLLDPSAKYSSTNDFADDGGLYMDPSDNFITFTPTGSSEIASFLATTLAKTLNSARAQQFYVQTFPWVNMAITTLDSIYYWGQTSRADDETTGYFYNSNGPAGIGIYATGNVRFITEGALLRFVAPAGFYFDQNNLLIEGLPGPSDTTYIWVSVSSVTGDGSNNGVGNLSTGVGPVVLSALVPDQCRLTTIIPSFTNSLGSTVIQECITQINLKNNFTLVFDNSLLANQDRWSISTFTDTNYFVKFESQSSGSYLVTYRSLAYYFGSANEIRFTYDRDKVIYDPLSGKLMQDYITILKSNSQPISNNALARDIKLNVIGQATESDGYVDDYAVEVSTIDATTNYIRDPDIFAAVTGYVTGFSNYQYFTFFQQITDSNMLSRYVMIPSENIVYQYGTLQDITIVRYEFPVNTIFYAPFDDAFYITVTDTVNANVIHVTQLTNYMAKTGRQGLYFQYRHISSETTRINPATTNIIDLYLVTQGYYTQYKNWILDTTGTITEPTPPSINDLITAYSNLNNFKMLTDSVIMNSVQFKPLFGSKADTKLQATIKVIKNANTTASDSEIRTLVLTEINNYFSIDNWNFGDTFYFSELSAYLHSVLGDYINSVVLVPNDPNLVFGDLYEIRSTPYEIFISCAQATDITIISALTPSELQT